MDFILKTTNDITYHFSRNDELYLITNASSIKMSMDELFNYFNGPVWMYDPYQEEMLNVLYLSEA